jgi:hypothetical protein
MSKKHVISVFCLSLAGLLSTTLRADVSDYNLSFGPYVGGGTQSNGADVRHSSGFKVAMDRRFFIAPGISVGPRAEVGNGIVSTKLYSADRKILSTYDNRFFTGGIKIGKLYGDADLTDEFYLTLLTGFAQTKLEEEESADNTFVQKKYHGIQGQYSIAEIGTKIQVRRNFSLDLAVVGHLYKANQNKANANIEGTVSDKNGSHALQDDSEQKEQFDHLNPKIVQKTLAATLGISLGF